VKRRPTARAFTVMLALLPVAGCGGPPEPKAGATQSATVGNPVSEDRLTTVTLAAEAEDRLGIRITPAARQAVRATRTIGGEVVVPVKLAGTGQSPVAVTASSGGLANGAENLLAAEAEATQARIAAESATQAFERVERMLRDQTGSVRAAEEAQAHLRLARATLEAAETRRTLIRRATVRGPERPWIRVPLYVGDLHELDTARDARVRVLGDESSPGWVAHPTTGPPSANADAATVDLFYEVVDDAGLRPAEKVAVTLDRLTDEEALVVPWSAIVHDIHGGEWVYERVAPQTFARRRVQVTRVVDGLALLTSGPDPGAGIVAEGAAELFGVEFGLAK
jgi:hypothetical protein